jgi:hypothetical protein
MDIELPLDFKEFLKLLNEKKVRYLSRVVDLLDDIQVNIIDLKHLKINKKASGRLKDLADLENLP